MYKQCIGKWMGMAACVILLGYATASEINHATVTTKQIENLITQFRVCSEGYAQWMHHDSSEHIKQALQGMENTERLAFMLSASTHFHELGKHDSVAYLENVLQGEDSNRDVMLSICQASENMMLAIIDTL